MLAASYALNDPLKESRYSPLLLKAKNTNIPFLLVRFNRLLCDFGAFRSCNYYEFVWITGLQVCRSAVCTRRTSCLWSCFLHFSLVSNSRRVYDNIINMNKRSVITFQHSYLNESSIFRSHNQGTTRFPNPGKICNVLVSPYNFQDRTDGDRTALSNRQTHLP